MMLFNKVNNYNKITIRLYPNGTVKGFYDCSIDFDDGTKAIEKYNKLCEKYKKLSLNAQSNTSENSSLSNDTLKITIFVGVYAFTLHSELVLPNIEYMKVLAQMDEEQLSTIQAHYVTITDMSFPDIFLFEDYIREAFKLKNKDLGVLSPNYKIIIKLHNSYTKMHIAAIINIVKSFVGDNYKKENDVITIESEDMILRATMTDLAMSKYFDITIEE